MMVYISTDRVLMRFDRLQAIADGVVFSGAEKLCGKWAEFKSDAEEEYRAVWSAVSQTNLFNYEVLSLFGQTISGNEEHFERNGAYYVLDREASDALFGSFSGISSGDDAESDGSFEVDLSDPSEPQIKFGISASATSKSPSGSSPVNSPSVSLSSSVSEEDVFTFMNIDNTVIHMPSSLDTMPTQEFVDAMKDFAKIMEGKQND